MPKKSPHMYAICNGIMYYLKVSYRVVKTKREWAKDAQYSFVIIGNGEHTLWVATSRL
jgi:hypothetical protein